MKKQLFFILSVCICFNAFSQNLDYKNSPLESTNYFELVNQIRDQFRLKKENQNFTRFDEKAEKQFERWAYIWKDRINTDGTFPYGKKLGDFKNEILNSFNKNQNTESSQSWSQVGPIDNPAINGYAAFPGKGRINVVVQDPLNAQILYAGSAAGGIWKSLDGGNSWAPKSDNLAGLGITDILVDPTNTNIIYIATGDENARHISSIGLFKSTDGGDTWLPTGLTFNLGENEYIRDISFDPNDSTRIFALTNSNIKISNDSGVNWTDVNNSPDYTNERFQTIIFDPNNSTNIIVSDIFGGIWFSTDSGANFTEHSVLQGATTNHLKLTTSANDNTFFYGINRQGEFKKYRFSLNNTANDLISTTAISGFDSQSGYNLCIAVSPINSNHIMVGGVRAYTSTDNGNSFTVTLNPYNDPPGVGFYVHPDHHHLSFLDDGVTILNGHDGGVHRGTFNGNSSNWTDLSPGLVITQPYNIAITQSTNGDDFLMANQDNDGFSKVLKDGVRQWVSALAGDGTAAGIDYSNPAIRYLGSTSGKLYRSNDGYASDYASASILLNRDRVNASFVSPMAIHPTVPTTIYAAHGDVKKSNNSGNSFTPLNSGLTKIDFIDITTYNATTRIFVISENGTAKKSDDDGNSWTTLTPPTGEVFNSFSALPNSNTVYATVKAYNDGNKVYKSTDNGNTWTNISNGLPNIIMKKIAVKVDIANETLFLGTELGMYWKNNSMTNWAKLGTNLPNVIITDLKINYTDQELYIGTFGRGMWKINVNDSTLGGYDDIAVNEFSVSVFPNPILNNEFNIKIPSKYLNDEFTYKLYNFVGGLIKIGNITNTISTISTNNLASGTYLLRIENNQISTTKKLIVE